MRLSHEIVAYDRYSGNYRAACPIAERHVAAVARLAGLPKGISRGSSYPVGEREAAALSRLIGWSFDPIDCRCFLELYEAPPEELEGRDPIAA